ncbi:MAG TPA: hypothetical protein DCE41_03180 [Cytophagales bacterium]|nr:hypothetical protein [Cytophagales bacterium]HAA23432.1 hypothetical protein [Cytophagales bacterium]HAP58627.1 hypothetical protein [Cytophagales bacterium]
MTSFSKGRFHIIFLLLFFTTIGCEIPFINQPPKDFNVEVSEVTFFSALIKWPEPQDPEGTTVNYKVYFEGQLLVDNYTDRWYTLSDLAPNTEYSGYVVAFDVEGVGRSSDFTFTTVENQPPVAFQVAMSEVSITNASLNWSGASDPDGHTVKFHIDLDGERIASDLTDSTFRLTGLTYDTEYLGVIIAEDELGLTTHSPFEFRTLPASPDFSIPILSLEYVSSTTALVRWTSGIDVYGKANTQYKLYVSGNDLRVGGVSQCTNAQAVLVLGLPLNREQEFILSYQSSDGKIGKDTLIVRTEAPENLIIDGDFEVSDPTENAPEGEYCTVTYGSNAGQSGENTIFPVWKYRDFAHNNVRISSLLIGAHSGERFISMNNGNSLYYYDTYFGTRLYEDLVPGEEYELTFWVHGLEQYSDTLGVTFGIGARKIPDYNALNSWDVYPTIAALDLDLSSGEWQQISVPFTVQGDDYDLLTFRLYRYAGDVIEEYEPSFGHKDTSIRLDNFVLKKL